MLHACLTSCFVWNCMELMLKVVFNGIIHSKSDHLMLNSIEIYQFSANLPLNRWLFAGHASSNSSQNCIKSSKFVSNLPEMPYFTPNCPIFCRWCIMKWHFKFPNLPHFERYLTKITGFRIKLINLSEIQSKIEVHRGYFFREYAGDLCVIRRMCVKSCSKSKIQPPIGGIFFGRRGYFFRSCVRDFVRFLRHAWNRAIRCAVRHPSPIHLRIN